MERERVRAAARGAVAGIIGAACMTVLRSAARRAGWIEKTVPQVLEERLTRSLRESAAEPSSHRALDQILHLGYGALLGAVYGPLAGPAERPWGWRALGLGAATWLFGAAIVVPLTGAGRGAWRRSATENGIDLGAHLAFGVATELVRGDLARHERRGEIASEERRGSALG